MSQEPYAKLTELAKETTILRDAAALLSWDQETYMPPQGVAYRASEMAYLSGKAHELFTASQVGDWISACENNGFTPDSPEGANVREWRFHYDRATQLPVELVKEFEETCSLAKAAWSKARKASDFAAFEPYLEKLISLSKQKAERFGYEDHPFDALLADYERGARTSEITTLFQGLRSDLVELIQTISERGPRVPQDLLEGNYPEEGQKLLNQEVAEALGFDFESGRIDTAAHPFCSGVGPADTRLTTRYNTADFTSSLFGVMHEAGHGLYDQGLPGEGHAQPYGQAVSLGVHESQSRLWENHVGRSREFWERWLPRAAEIFPDLKKLSVEEMFYAVNQAHPSFIRVESDEVTYDLHIMIRFELEKALFDGRLKVKDIPGEWNRLYKEYLGVEVDKDSNGCLQDIHWSLGIFGYFPTYTLGNLNASHLMTAVFRERPETKTELEAGQYLGLLGWLREKIHLQGSLYLPMDLMRNATGEPVSPKAHLDHLKERYL